MDENESGRRGYFSPLKNGNGTTLSYRTVARLSGLKIAVLYRWCTVKIDLFFQREFHSSVYIDGFFLVRRLEYLLEGVI